MNFFQIGGSFVEQVFECGTVRLVCDRLTGSWSFFLEETPVLVNVFAEADFADRTVSSADFVVHIAVREGNIVRFSHVGCAGFDGRMEQVFELDEPLYTSVVLCGSAVKVNRIAPIVLSEGGLGIGEDGVFVRIPFDNDMWVEPSVTAFAKLGPKTVGYEVAAFFEKESGVGMVIGSVEHDVWKTGIRVDTANGRMTGGSVFGGIADEGTRDNSPHGFVCGTEVRSPRMFIGRFADWRDGLTAYGKANTAVVPKKVSVPDVPLGYNSWGVLQDKVSFSDMIAVSDYIRENFQDIWSEGGVPVYVNIDSFWDFLVHNDPALFVSGQTLEGALREFVEHCHANEQKAGIYFTPFTAWHGDEDGLKSSKMEGSDYTFYDAAVKKSDGSGLYGKLDGGYALDPTHPGTIARFEEKLRWFIDLGFEYVKLDFMTHGAVEGQHYDPAVSTGMQAYNAGMARIRAICEGKMFVNLSIAPLFPYQYADGRRMSCDAFSSIDNTRHLLSYLTACFWEKEIYPFPDPDHLVVWGKDGQVTDGEARCRVTSGLLAGTSFLVGDDLANGMEAAKQDRLHAMFGNADIVTAAKLGCAFRPYAVTPGERCAEAYLAHSEVDDALYLAVFNFDEGEKEVEYELAKVLPKSMLHEYEVRELWRGDTMTLDEDILRYTIPAADAAMFRIAATDMVIGKAEVPKENKNYIPVALGAAAVLFGAALVYRNQKKKK